MVGYSYARKPLSGDRSKQISKQFSSAIPYTGGGDLLADARTIIDSARQYAYSAINVALVLRNWLLGKRISEEELIRDAANELIF